MVFNIQDSDTRRVKTDFDRKVKKLEHVKIPMPDGKTLRPIFGYLRTL